MSQYCSVFVKIIVVIIGKIMGIAKNQCLF